MPLPINIQDLLRKQKIESNRIEFKKGWNPDKIYHSICAFANDIDNIGGGYILVGVDEDENGLAKRPLVGLPIDSLDKIQKEMIGFNNKIEPYYMPRVDVEEVDGKYVLVIWVPTGANRPYNVRERVTATNQSLCNWYVRSGTSSIEAKGEVLDELRDMASRVPFDDRGNPNITLDDISAFRMRDYLIKVGSKLKESFRADNMEEILEAMDLYDGPIEDRTIKNVAAMMFCDHPQKFFPVSRVEIVLFPDGCIKNPDNMIEAPIIEGPVPEMIDKTLSYLKTNVIKEQIIKQTDDLRSIHFFNYPYQALEEAVTNSLYHRDYQEREPVEITIEPHGITLLSFTGPDRSVSFEAIKKGERLCSRRYRNRRLGDFLKELEYTEGRSTGIPTMQQHLKRNGSPRATFETNEERSYFMTFIPIHQAFIEQDSLKDTDVAQGVAQGVANENKDLKIQILEMITQNNKMTREKIANNLGVSKKTIERELKKMPMVKYVGSGYSGYWEITEK